MHELLAAPAAMIQAVLAGGLADSLAAALADSLAKVKAAADAAGGGAPIATPVMIVLPQLIVAAAMLVEGTVEWIASGWLSGKKLQIASLVAAVTFTIIYHVNLLAALGFTQGGALAGYIGSGIIISRGSNVVNSLFTSAQAKSAVLTAEANGK
jgi:hypothetical protein